MGGLSCRTKIQSRHVLRSQCWPDGCRTFAFCCTDRASLLSLRIFVHTHTNCQIEFSIAYRWNRITTRGKMDIHPPKNVRRGAPKGGIASTQGEACPPPVYPWRTRSCHSRGRRSSVLVDVLKPEDDTALSVEVAQDNQGSARQMH